MYKANGIVERHLSRGLGEGSTRFGGLWSVIILLL